MKAVLASLCAMALLAGCSAQPTAQSKEEARPPVTGSAQLTIESRGRTHVFDVQVANSEQEQEKGLMFRKSIPDNGGMLFPFDPPRTASFWMANTPASLDMLFVQTDGTIVFIAPDRAPNSREPISAGIPVSAVVELRGGRTAELGIQEGDKVSWKD